MTESSGDDGFDARVNGIAALGEPVRRALYKYVVAQAGPVSRDQAATGAGVARHTAKFHLDKLVEDGLLEVEFSRPPGRRGPGAGRPTKFYRRAAREVAVSLPERHYELAGRLLARAITDAKRDDLPVGDTLRDAARDVGRGLGHQARKLAGPRAGRAALVDASTEVLTRCGYEPRPDADGVTLANCPFHALAQEYTELVCGMNLELMNGLVEGLDRAPFEACLEPAPGRCCVRLKKATA
ncbi:MAG TPA: helix-turn-helix domain-containing protein [Acidimicrobiia bacterium]|nr:helix-turn-helix domain-containing protein [Acidimicrobiia bacterium]